MADPIPLSALPRPKTPEKYDRRITEESLQWFERELAHKMDTRRDAYLGVGKSLVLTSETTNTPYKLGLDADDYLTLTNYKTGVVGTVVIDMPRVDGLVQEFIDVRSEFAAADDTLAASVSANALAITDAETAIGTLETEVIAARDGEASLAAKIGVVEAAVVSGDGANATRIETVAARASSPNLLVNTDFEGGLYGYNTGWNGGVTIAARGLNWPGQHSARNVMYVFVSGTPAAGNEFDLYGTGCYFINWTVSDARNFGVPVKPGDRIHVSWDVASVNLGTAHVYAQFHDKDGVYVTQSIVASGTGTVGEPTGLPSDFTRIGGFITVPSGCYVAGTFVRGVTNGAGNPGLWGTAPMIGFATDAAQTTLPDYVPGREASTASVTTLTNAFVDPSTGAAFASFDVEAAAGGFSAMLRMYAGDGTSSIGLYAEQLFLGNNTVFEDTYNTFYNTYSSKRLRIFGPFGASGDIVDWYGPTSVALNSETKTNGYFARATDGKTYADGAELTGPLSVSISGSMVFEETDGAASTVTTSTATAVASGGDGSYTYQWAIVGRSYNGSATSVNLALDFSASSASQRIELSNCPSYFLIYFTVMVTVTDGQGAQTTAVLEGYANSVPEGGG
jgi:hypothetical protein